MYIVGFNGPPRSGKDTMAAMLADKLDSRTDLPVMQVSLVQILRDMAMAAFGIANTQTAYDSHKDMPTALNVTVREFMIGLSENYFKPTYGKNVYGELLLQKLSGFDGVVLIRDIGFQHEVEFWESLMGPDQFYLARTGRPGTSWDGDSRESCAAQQMGDYDNVGTLDDWRTEADRLYGRLVNQIGWAL